MRHALAPNEWRLALWVKLNVMVKLFHRYACNTLTFTRYNETVIQQTSLQSIT
jgi:hypothetical protein